MAEKRRRRRSPLPHVALIVETSTAYGRAILSGISQYVREHGPWTVYIEQRSLQDPAPPWLERWDGDGIIARASTPKSARKLLRTGIPTVDLNDQVRGLGLPQIHSDHAAIARTGRRTSDGSRFPSFRLLRLSRLRMVGAPQSRHSPAMSSKPGTSFTRACPLAASPGATSKLPGKMRSKASLAGSRDCPSPWESWPATTSAASRCSTRVAGPAWPYRRRSRSSASTTRSSSACWPILPFPA